MKRLDKSMDRAWHVIFWAPMKKKDGCIEYNPSSVAISTPSLKAVRVLCVAVLVYVFKS